MYFENYFIIFHKIYKLLKFKQNYVNKKILNLI